MAFANILVRLDRAESPSPKLRADFADGFSLRQPVRQFHEQAICKLVALLAAIDVGCDHFDRARLVECLDELRGSTLALESSERTCGFVAAFLRQPFTRLTVVPFFQKRIHNNAVDVNRRNVELCRFAAKSRQQLVLCRSRAICFGTDNPAIEVESLGEQSSVAQPDSIPANELAVNGRDFHLELPVVVPFALDSRAVNHCVFAEQSLPLIPLATDTVQQSVLELFLRCALTILVPSADYTMPATIPQWHTLAKLSASIKTVLDGGTHKKTPTWSDDPSQLWCSFSICRFEDSIKTCSARIGKRRGANSTCPHERHCEAPLRETRQAAPDWARASAALSSSEISQFSRGTWPLRREMVRFVITSCVSANSIAGNMDNKMCLWLQHRFPSINPASLPLNRAATDSRDEEPKGKLPGGGGRVKGGTEARTPSERPVVSLTRVTTPHNRNGSHRAVLAQAEWLASEMRFK